MKIVHLRTNHLKNPLGYDFPYLVLSWKVTEAVASGAETVSDPACEVRLIISEKEDGVALINEILPMTPRQYVIQKIFVGFVLGCLSAKGILTAALNQLSPEMFLAGSREQLQALIDANSTGKWGYLLISTLVTLAFTFLAAAPAAPPAEMPSRVSVPAMTRQATRSIPR